MSHRSEKNIEEIVASYIDDPTSAVNSKLINKLEYVAHNVVNTVATYSGTDGVWQNALSLTKVLSTGNYLLFFKYGWNTSNTGTSFLSRIRLDSAPSADNWLSESYGPPTAAGSTGTGRYSATGTNKKYIASGFREFAITSAGTHVLDLDYSKVGGAGTPLCSIWDRIIILFKFPQEVI